ncbi:hypothetical protein BJ928_104128 [Rhizobium sp. WW_1]|jgi:hypothetical protein|nr:hypothetical protein BJ928_104128 [Rhizobium sp. WW_1]
MFTSLPLPRGVDADELLRGYLVALEGLLPSTLKSVVLHLVRGTWHEEVKFCPRPPELANMVRFEQRRVDAVNRPRLPAPATIQQPFKDIRITQRNRADELQTAGYHFHSNCESLDKFKSGGRNGQYPSGSIHLWAIDEVWAPRQIAQEPDTARTAA